MTHKRLIVLILVFLVLSTLSAAHAAPESVSLTPIADDIAVFDNSALNTESPLVAGGSSATGAVCISQFETFLKYERPASIPVGSTLTSAVLTLRSMGFPGGSSTLTLKLFGSLNDGWSQGAGQIPWESKPSLDSDLAATVTGVVATGGNIVFPSTPQLVSFLNTQLNGDGIATIAIQAIECNSGISRQYFASMETTGANGIPATLTVSGTKPNSVTLTDFATDNAAPTWPLYAGLGALALLAVAGVTISRRRALR